MLKILVIDESHSRAGEICAGLAPPGHEPPVLTLHLANAEAPACRNLT